MSMGTSRTKLISAVKDLHIRWDRVKTRWNDPVSKEFEEEFLASLEGKVRGSVQAIEDMDALLRRARKECG